MALRMLQRLIWLALLSAARCSPIIPIAPHAVLIRETTQLRSDYDYVVIGGGTSGLVVANSLTEDPNSA